MNVYISSLDHDAEAAASDVVLVLKELFGHCSFLGVTGQRLRELGIRPDPICKELCQGSQKGLLSRLASKGNTYKATQRIISKSPQAVVLIGMNPWHQNLLLSLHQEKIPCFILATAPVQSWTDDQQALVKASGTPVLGMYPEALAADLLPSFNLIGHPFVNRINKIHLQRSVFGWSQDEFVVLGMLPAQPKARAKALKVYANLYRRLQQQLQQQPQLPGRLRMVIANSDQIGVSPQDLAADDSWTVTSETMTNEVISCADFAFAYDFNVSLQCTIKHLPHTILHQGRIQEPRGVNRLVTSPLIKEMIPDASGQKLAEYLLALASDTWQRSKIKKDLAAYARDLKPLNWAVINDIFGRHLARRSANKSRRKMAN